MSDTTTAQEAPAQDITQIPVKVLEKDGGKITPELLVIGRGEAEGNVYPAIVVTKENLNEYVKVRGLDSVLDTLNARERLDAQAALDYVLQDNDWEETGKTDSKGKPKFAYSVKSFLAVIDKFWETLLSGKVRGGVTIESLENEQEDLMEQMRKRLSNVINMAPDKIKDYMLETNKLSIKYQSIKEQVDEIRKNRKPRKTKAEKLAELEAGKAAAAKAAAQAAASASASQAVA